MALAGRKLQVHIADERITDLARYVRQLERELVRGPDGEGTANTLDKLRAARFDLDRELVWRGRGKGGLDKSEQRLPYSSARYHALGYRNPSRCDTARIARWQSREGGTESVQAAMRRAEEVADRP